MTDIEILATLGERDTQVDRLNRAIEQARKQLEAATEAVRAGKAALVVQEAEIAAHTRHTHDLERRTDEYRTRERGAIRMLEIGAGNADAAEKQLAQCRKILDETETEQLVAMERDDALKGARKQSITSIATAEADLARVASAVPVTIAAANAELAEANAARDVAIAALPEDMRKRYEQLRATKKRNAIVRIVSGACSACQMHVHLQQLSELRRGQISPCNGCGRWIIP